MSADVVWLGRARSDLVRIGVRLARINPRASESLVARLTARANLLAEQPRIGSRRPDIRADVRQLVVMHHLILYRTIPDSDDDPVTLVETVSVVDGRRDLERLF